MKYPRQLLALACLCTLLCACAALPPAEPEQHEITAWSSVTVGVRDLDAALMLWVDTFGLDVIRHEEGPDPELARLWHIAPGDIVAQALVTTGDKRFGMLHLVEFDNPDPPVRHDAEVFDLVPKNLDVYVDDLPRRFEELTEQGRRFRTERYSEVTAPDGTRFREIHMPSHDDINVVLLEVIGKSLPFTDKGFSGIGPLIYIVPDAAKEKAFARNVLELDKLNDNLLKGPEIERMVGLPPGSGLDVSIWGRADSDFGDIEIIEYQGVRGRNLYPRTRPKALGILHISYVVSDANGLLRRVRDSGAAVTGHGFVTTLTATGTAWSFVSPAGLRIEVYESAKTTY